MCAKKESALGLRGAIPGSEALGRKEFDRAGQRERTWGQGVGRVNSVMARLRGRSCSAADEFDAPVQATSRSQDGSRPLMGHAGANGDLIPTAWSVVAPTDASKRLPSAKAPAASRCSRVVLLHPV